LSYRKRRGRFTKNGKEREEERCEEDQRDKMRYSTRVEEITRMVHRVLVWSTKTASVKSKSPLAYAETGVFTSVSLPLFRFSVFNSGVGKWPLVYFLEAQPITVLVLN
jgi:hypothetical protein